MPRTSNFWLERSPFPKATAAPPPSRRANWPSCSPESICARRDRENDTAAPADDRRTSAQKIFLLSTELLGGFSVLIGMSQEAPSPDDVAAVLQELERLRQALAHAEAALAETATTCEQQQAELTRMREELELFKRALYGRRSERHIPDPEQELLPFGAADEPPLPLPAPPEEEEIAYRRRRKGHGWGKLPEHLPREEVLVDVPEADRTCSCCGETMQKIGEDRSERVDLTPAKIRIKVIVRPKYACSKQHGIRQASSPPSPVPGGRFDFGLVAHVVTSKTADHLPLYRQQDILARSGLELSRSTLCEIMAGAAELLEPLAAAMKRRLLATDLVGADDTPVRLLDDSHPEGVRLARFWLFRGFEAAPYNVFHFHESRSRDGPSGFLQGFRGTVKVDAYGVDQGVYLGSDGRIVASCCLAHARRKFEEAMSSHPRLAAEALAYIRQLYDLEDRARDFTPEDRRVFREREATLLLAQLRTWLDAQGAMALPKLKFGEAVRYSLNQWPSLTNYVDDGRLPIDNNATERDLRSLTIGRNNWLFIGSLQAGPRAAVLYTVVSSAVRHHLDVWAYLRDVLERLAVLRDSEGASVASGEQLQALLPDEWGKSHPQAVHEYRKREQEREAASQRTRREKRRAAALAKAARGNG